MKKIININSNTVLEIVHDTDCENPREGTDTYTKFIFFGKHSHIGDEHIFNSDNYQGWDDMKARAFKDALVVTPVFMYVHSGSSISTTPFNCRWDSGQLGFAVVYAKDIRKEFGVKRVSKKLKEQIESYIESEVQTLNQWLNGDIFGFRVLQDEEEIDSCWGFYGDEASNGIFDHIDAPGFSFDEYKVLYDVANWEEEEEYQY